MKTTKFQTCTIANNDDDKSDLVNSTELKDKEEESAISGALPVLTKRHRILLCQELSKSLIGANLGTHHICINARLHYSTDETRCLDEINKHGALQYRQGHAYGSCFGSAACDFSRC